MIEITAKQLYDIYIQLPNPDKYIEVENIPFVVSLKQQFCGITIAPPLEFVFVIDENDYPLEWKPTTDLIIKA